MAANTPVITKSYRDGLAWTEALMDGIRSDIIAQEQDTVDNINQLRLDIFGSDYAYDNDGTANNTNPIDVSFTITPTATLTGLDIAGSALTTGTALDASDLNSLTTGFGLNLVSNSADGTTRTIAQFTNDNTAATGCTSVQIQQDAAVRALFIDQNANAQTIYIDSEQTTASIINIDSNTLTTGSLLVSPSADALTTGGFFSLTSNSADASGRALVSIVNDNTAATGAQNVSLQQDANQRALFIDYNGTGGSVSSAPIYVDSEGTSGAYWTVNGNGDGIRIDMENGVFNNNAIEVQCIRAASSVYNFFEGSSGGAADIEVRLRGDGSVEGDAAAYVTPAADYAEMFECEDKEKGIEPGFFVALGKMGKDNKRKLIKATSKSKRVIGLVSGKPAVVGDTDWNRWAKKYLYDEFNRYLINSKGERILNPKFDASKIHVPRRERPEWVAVGLVGKLNVRTSEDIKGNFVDVDDKGQAVNGTTYEVLEILRQRGYDPEHVGYGVVKILFRGKE